MNMLDQVTAEIKKDNQDEMVIIKDDFQDFYDDDHENDKKNKDFTSENNPHNTDQDSSPQKKK